MRQFFFHLLKFLLEFQEIIFFFVGLCDDLLLLLEFFNNLLVFQYFLKVTKIVVNNLNLIRTFVWRKLNVYVFFEFFLKVDYLNFGLKTRNLNSVMNRIDNFDLFLNSINDAIMETSPMQIKNEENQHGKDIADSCN